MILLLFHKTGLVKKIGNIKWNQPTNQCCSVMAATRHSKSPKSKQRKAFLFTHCTTAAASLDSEVTVSLWLHLLYVRKTHKHTAGTSASQSLCPHIPHLCKTDCCQGKKCFRGSNSTSAPGLFYWCPVCINSHWMSPGRLIQRPLLNVPLLCV